MPLIIAISEIETFWENKHRILSKRKDPKIPLVLLADTIARIGSIVSDSIGPHHSDPQDELGQLFHNFLSRQRFFIPSTFPEFSSEAPSHTWTHQGGTLHRIDFIGIPYKWSSADIALSAWVLRSVCLALSRPDHFAVALSVCMSHESVDILVNQRSDLFDRKAVLVKRK